MPSITGHSLLVIGGTSGIGFAVAQLALEQGVRLAIASSNPDRVTSAVDRLRGSAPTGTSSTAITGHVCDLSQADVEDRLEALLKAVTDDGTNLLDHIVYTTTLIEMKPIAAFDRAYLRDATQFALVAPLLLAKLAPRFMNQAPTSSITYTGGRVGEKPVRGYLVGGVYGAGLFGMVRSLALEMAPLRVNYVSPGSTETEMWGDEGARARRREVLSGTALLGKVGRPEEVGEAYVYLMRDSNVTGTGVYSSGGSLVQ